MCGRFVQAFTTDELSESLSSLGYQLLLDGITGTGSESELPKSYNIGPSQSPLGLSLTGTSIHLQSMLWGFPPFRPKGKNGSISPINARLDRVRSSKYFATSLKNSRVVVPISGYYEWKTQGRVKTPFYIHGSQSITYLAALSREQPDESSPRFVILTTDAHPDLAHIHDREPLILSSSDFQQWGNNSHELSTDFFLTLTKPKSSIQIEVSKAVNSMANNDKTLIDPVDSSDSLGI